jgi:hypothetical protein
MTNDPHTHLDEGALERAARVFSVEGAAPACAECAERVREFARYRSLAGLGGRQGLAPHGRPAVDAIRGMRRRTFARRAGREVGAILSFAATRGAS